MTSTGMQQSDQQVNGPASTIIQQLADRLGAQARASTVYGEPVERDGVTVIPVARVRWGFGGGGGTSTGEAGEGSGSGGGGGVMASPIGYIEIKNGESRYRPVRDPV